MSAPQVIALTTGDRLGVLPAEMAWLDTFPLSDPTDRNAGERLGIVCVVATDVSPLLGSVGLVDWRIDGQISRAQAGGIFAGEPGQSIDLGACQQLGYKRLCLVGAGEIRSGECDWNRVAATLLQMRKQAFDVEQWAVVLPQVQGESHILAVIAQGLDGAVALAEDDIELVAEVAIAAPVDERSDGDFDPASSWIESDVEPHAPGSDLEGDAEQNPTQTVGALAVGQGPDEAINIGLSALADIAVVADKVENIEMHNNAEAEIELPLCPVLWWLLTDEESLAAARSQIGAVVGRSDKE